VDVFTPRKRSRLMASIRSTKNRTTELRLIFIFRKASIVGWRRRYPLFGRPDFVFPRAKLAIFVDGCFWHGCPRCYRAPRSSKTYWNAKLSRNKARDLIVSRHLRSKGWRVLRVWECRLERPALFLRQIAKILDEEKKDRHLSY